MNTIVESNIKGTNDIVENAFNPSMLLKKGGPQIFNMDTNYATQNKWYAHFALEDILGPSYSNLNLHLQRFSLPQLEQTSNEVSYRGYTKEIPAKVLNPSTKQLTLDYIVDHDWRNYKALYSWMSGTYGAINPIVDNDDTQSIYPSDYLPLRIYLLSPYKQKIIQFLFNDCWIKVFNEISLDVANSGEVTHSFTMVYDEYTIEDIQGKETEQ